jgi:hypothetical protein
LVDFFGGVPSNESKVIEFFKKAFNLAEQK